jgi:hypothetical protein
MRTSFYADDAALFINLEPDQVTAVFNLLEFFGQVSGLRINSSKCTVFPISCGDRDIHDMTAGPRCKVGLLPCTHLGLPLGYRSPTRSECQTFIDKIAAKLKPCRGKLMNRAGRLTLVNSVLTSVMTYFLTIFDPPSIG